MNSYFKYVLCSTTFDHYSAINMDIRLIESLELDVTNFKSCKQFKMHINSVVLM